jgi:phosphoserine phosphatase RsbU/P
MVSIDELPCYYFAINEKAEIVACNQTLALDLDYDKDELIGKSVEKIFPVATRIFFQTHFAPLIKLQGFSSEIFITLSGKDKKKPLPVLCNAKTVLSDGEPVIVFISMRVENRNKFEQALIEAKTQAEKALNENSELKISRETLQKNFQELDANVARVKRQNDELKQLHHIMSHELQEPLRKISVFSDLILNEKGDKLPIGTIQKLAKASSRLRSVMEGLQNYVSLSDKQTSLKTININTAVISITEQLKKKYPGKLFSIFSDTIPVLKGNEEQIKRLFFEILDNSLQFAKPGKDLIIQITSQVLHQNRFQHIPGKYDFQDHLRIQVTDNGIGFKPGYTELIFDLFKKLKSTENTGIGLAFARKIMENHGGKISVESSEGAGTTVTLIFPYESAPGLTGTIQA